MTTVPRMDQPGTTCAVCGAKVSWPQGFSVTIEKADRAEMWKHFCSWEHISEWAGRGEPEFDGPPEGETLGDKAFKFGCLLVAIVLIALVVVGAVAVVRTLV